MLVLLTASTGGHLAQLHQLRPRLVRPDDEVIWMTFDSPQSRSLLEGEQVVHLPYVSQRDVRGVLRAAATARRALRGRPPQRAISTGSAIALAVLPVARALGADCLYVESAARSAGPSLTGRLLSHMPGVRTETQYAGWASTRWPQHVSVFDDFHAGARHGVGSPLRVVVTLGTLDFGFVALVEALVRALPADADVLWQLGGTPVPAALGGRAVAALPHADLLTAMEQADLVVAHAGVGSALAALSVGRRPVLVPRRAARREHVDDHQVQIARELASRGLAVHLEVDGVTAAALTAAAGGRVAAPGRA
ncbi:MAG: glycosyl transferase family 28 [Actinotalea sp.]|nr:glycosyl transferase family 28 [Actinotalea sp.]